MKGLWRVFWLLFAMAVIAPYVTQLGRDFCGPEEFIPYRCGSFWWMLGLAIGPILIVVVSAFTARTKKC